MFQLPSLFSVKVPFRRIKCYKNSLMFISLQSFLILFSDKMRMVPKSNYCKKSVQKNYVILSVSTQFTISSIVTFLIFPLELWSRLKNDHTPGGCWWKYRFLTCVSACDSSNGFSIVNITQSIRQQNTTEIGNGILSIFTSFLEPFLTFLSFLDEGYLLFSVIYVYIIFIF